MNDDFNRVERFLAACVPQAMEEAGTPGFSIAVVREGGLVLRQGFGTRDPARLLPATPDTLYGVGSCTKAFVAIAVLQLVDEGKLRLEDPVERFLPLSLKAPGGPITVRHLLSHSSGIPSLSTSTILLHHGLGYPTGIPLGNPGDFYRFINAAQAEVADGPGKLFFYNNAGYRMLGHLVQEASGRPFHEHLMERVISPLGMARTTLLRSAFEKDPDVIVPQLKKPDGSLIAAVFPYPDITAIPDFSFLAAAGGLISSVSEMAIFLIANMDGQAKGAGRALLSPASLKTMQELHIERPPNSYGRYGYGYGWGITESFLGHKMVAHGGSILVSTAHLAFLPDRGLGVASAANAADFPHAAVAEGVLAASLGEDPWQAVPVLRIKERMRLLCGTYEVYRGVSRARVLRRAGMLYLEQKGPTSESLAPLIPEDPESGSDRFYLLVDGQRQPVEFVVKNSREIDLFIERYRFHKTQ